MEEFQVIKIIICCQRHTTVIRCWKCGLLHYSKVKSFVFDQIDRKVYCCTILLHLAGSSSRLRSSPLHLLFAELGTSSSSLCVLGFLRLLLCLVQFLLVLGKLNGFITSSLSSFWSQSTLLLDNYSTVSNHTRITLPAPFAIKVSTYHQGRHQQ